MRKLGFHGVQLACAVVAVLVLLFLADAVAGRFLFISINRYQMPNRTIDREKEFWGVSVTTNSDGFRDTEFQIEKSPGRRRILLVGDSATFGSHVLQERIFASRLDVLLDNRDPDSDWEVYNLGLPGMLAMDFIHLVRDVARNLDPDYIVVVYNQYSDRDLQGRKPATGFYIRPRWHENVAEATPSNLRRFLGTKAMMTERAGEPPPVPSLRWYTDALNSENRLRRSRAERIDPTMIDELWEMGMNRNSLPERALERPDLLNTRIGYDGAAVVKPFARANFTRIVEIARRSDAEFVLLLIPSWETGDTRTWETLRRMGYVLREPLKYDRRFDNTHTHFARTLGVPVINARPYLAQSEVPVFFDSDPHFNAQGHALVAEALADWFLNEPPPTMPEELIEGAFDSVLKFYPAYSHFRDWQVHPAEARTSTVGKYRLSALPARLHLVNMSANLDTKRINRIRIRMRATKGDYGLVRWAKSNELSSDELNREFSRKQAYFPIVADGRMHEYEIAPGHVSLKWEGQAAVVEFLPAIAHEADQGDPGVVEIEWIDFGRRSDSGRPPNVWASVNEILGFD